MYLLINKCVTAVKVSNFSGHYLRNRSTLDIGVMGYIGIVQHKEHSPEVLSIPPGTRCIYFLTAHMHFFSVNGQSFDRTMETECHSRPAGTPVSYSKSSNLEIETGYPV